MDDETTIIPRPDMGITHVNRVTASHTISVIVSALNEAAYMASQAGGKDDETEQQSKLREAQQCATVAMSYLDQIIQDSSVKRVEWKANYNTYIGTVLETLPNGLLAVVPDGTDLIYLGPDEFSVVT